MTFQGIILIVVTVIGIVAAGHIDAAASRIVAVARHTIIMANHIVAGNATVIHISCFPSINAWFSATVNITALCIHNVFFIKGAEDHAISELSATEPSAENRRIRRTGDQPETAPRHIATPAADIRLHQAETDEITHAVIGRR
ncbi:hypothetical protein GFD17_07765 [Bifidobacterium sp. SMB2]|uniref:Secreted protein n=1 Tax=Bifidobacterium saimiriisciurei TaxID=2661627 RepID=A0ABX0CCN6_9BIFI|nr:MULTISPECIES: hypothetical protein [Bifidobacterium]NEG96648.1 hypothetical protein [Bifidobacterium sp. SMB2]NEH12421.1 hypothetical protein [Bifidobacterium saimiriisciurei]